MANGKPNGNGSGTSSMRHADLVLADAILGLCSDIRVECVKMEGLASLILHRRLVTTKNFRREFLDSVQRVGERHLQMVADVKEKLGA